MGVGVAKDKTDKEFSRGAGTPRKPRFLAVSGASMMHRDALRCTEYGGNRVGADQPLPHHFPQFRLVAIDSDKTGGNMWVYDGEHTATPSTHETRR